MDLERKYEASKFPFFSHLHLLVVEPNAALRDLFCCISYVWNIESTEVATFQEALHYLATHDISEEVPLLLLDGSLDESKVHAFLAQVHQYGSYPYIVMTTGPDTTRWSKRGITVLQKPFHLSTLQDAISDVLLKADTQPEENHFTYASSYR